MPAPKGTSPPAAGKGRPKGAGNKVSGELKAMILGALDKSGGEQYFVEQASKHPVAFMTLIGKILPLQLSGEGGGPVLIGGDLAERLARARERVAAARETDQQRIDEKPDGRA
jgi:hypothetical protein